MSRPLPEGFSDLDVNPEQWKDNILKNLESERSNKGSSEELKYFQYFPEFDEFEFPDSCEKATIFPVSFAKPGQVALDLRNRFSINLVGLKRGSTVFGPDQLTPKLSIQKGDVGIVIRTPHPSGYSIRVLQDEQVAALSLDHACGV